MPRQSHIDTPSALHHIIVRGIERGKIFKDDQDRCNFIDRLGKIMEQTKTGCFAWALIPDHFHLLLRSGSYPVATVMRQLLTGHAIYFNRRHRRHGHLFQNRDAAMLSIKGFENVEGPIGGFLEKKCDIFVECFLIILDLDHIVDSPIDNRFGDFLVQNRRNSKLF